MDAHERLRLVVSAAGLTVAKPPLPLPSHSNDAWKLDEFVLRICWRGDRTRLQREAMMLEHLPADVPHARLVTAGVVDDLTWTLTHWVPGKMLSLARANLDARTQRIAAEQLGHALRALHAWEPSPEVRTALAVRPAQPEPSDAVGADLNPLPVDRALRLIEPASHLENVDQRLVVRLSEEIERLRPIDPLTDPTEGVVVHGDAHLNNVIWNDTQVVALLDYEWVRLGPADLEIQPLLLAEDGTALIRSIVAAYPRIAAHPRFVERLWLYDLSATLRDLLVKVPLPVTDDLPPWHPKRRLRMILAGPGYIEELLGGP